MTAFERLSAAARWSSLHHRPARGDARRGVRVDICEACLWGQRDQTGARLTGASRVGYRQQLRDALIRTTRFLADAQAPLVYPKRPGSMTMCANLASRTLGRGCWSFDRESV